MDLRVRALRSVQLPPQSPMEEGKMTIAPVLPYRSSTMPENLSVRLKHPNVLCANSWLKRSPSDHSEHPNLRLRCSRYLDVKKRRSRPASLAPEVKHIDKSLPPPLPPKRISSQTSNLTTLSLKQKEFCTETNEDGKGKEEHSPQEVDIYSALQKITKRLDQLQVERSPILGHYSMLYRLDASIQMQPPQPPAFLPKLRPMSQRPNRCVYTNLAG
ncbi:conserved hypothetical protein [Echinococcus multilocularis]|uniref:Uncharacterized protein n=1 Tax=Echinococcus multilocularis TaxID=6211 RepID=A0A068Y2Q2_ECHMU|nr:conserved hypothetical protein [Echinococcus multilocularis]